MGRKKANRTDKVTPSPYGRALKAARESRGWSIRQLAAKAGMSAAAISRLESGHRKYPAWEWAIDLARALGLPLDHFGA